VNDFERETKAGSNPNMDDSKSDSTHTSTKDLHTRGQAKKTTKTKPKPTLMLPTIKATVNTRPATQTPSKPPSKAAKRRDQYKYLNVKEMTDGWT
jgi:hypothetical protein